MAWTRGGRELEMALKRVDGFGIDSEGEANSLSAGMEIGSERKKIKNDCRSFQLQQWYRVYSSVVIWGLANFALQTISGLCL